MVITAELQARVATLTSMTLGVYKDTLPENEYKNLYTNYVSSLEENLNKSFEGIDQILFDNQAFLQRQRFEVFSAIQHLKTDDNYLLSE